MALAIRCDPYLENLGALILDVEFRMLNAGSRTHNLNITGFGAATITQIVFMADRAAPHIGDDFHVAMAVGREPAFGDDRVIVPDT